MKMKSAQTGKTTKAAGRGKLSLDWAEEECMKRLTLEAYGKGWRPDCGCVLHS
jgi:hypothetical protein